MFAHFTDAIRNQSSSHSVFCQKLLSVITLQTGVVQVKNVGLFFNLLVYHNFNLNFPAIVKEIERKVAYNSAKHTFIYSTATYALISHILFTNRTQINYTYLSQVIKPDTGTVNIMCKIEEPMTLISALAVFSNT